MFTDKDLLQRDSMAQEIITKAANYVKLKNKTSA